MTKLTSGRCRTCQGRGTIAVVYQWKAGKGRRLYNASCPRCRNALDQTCVDNMKHFHIMTTPPTFTPSGTETAAHAQGSKAATRAYKDFRAGKRAGTSMVRFPGNLHPSEQENYMSGWYDALILMYRESHEVVS